jgi:hypothetical protein
MRVAHVRQPAAIAASDRGVKLKASIDGVDWDGKIS